MKKRVLGLDIGIASIGWAVVDFEEEKFDIKTGEITLGKILDSGVRCFTAAENPKTGESLAKPRRDKRLARRICRRKARRMQGIKNLFITKNLITKEKLEILYSNCGGTNDVWKLRFEALSEKLNTDEFLRVLTHIAKHRGFKSYRKALEESDAEGGKVLKAIKENKQFLENTGLQTMAQGLFNKQGLQGKKRNGEEPEKDKDGNIKKDKDGNLKKVGVYHNSIPREEIIKEIELIFEAQKRLGNSLANDNLLNDFKLIAFRHREIGAVGNMVGFCRFEYATKEKRAPKEAPSSELFIALGKINNFSIWDNSVKRFLSNEESEDLLNLLKTTKEIKYSTIRSKIFKNREDIKFADINYNPKPKVNKKGEIVETKPEDEKFYSMKGWHKLKSAIGEYDWEEFSHNIELLDKVVQIIAMEKNDDAINKGLQELNIRENIILKLMGVSFKEFINLSFKALNKIIPFMEQGLKYNEACEKAGYDFKDTGDKLSDKKSLLLPVIEQDKLTTVPAVNRAISQFRKVYNAIVRKYGCPDQINIEMARDIYHNHEERKKIEANQKAFREDKEKAADIARSQGIDPNRGANLLKYRLYEQQNGKCIYSGNPLDIRNLCDNGYCDIDHIIPYSRCLDDSLNNKVLCLSSENRMKSNKIPFEYLEPKGKWQDFVAIVKSMAELRKAKKDRLLKSKFNEEDMEGFKSRNINDTRYMAIYIKKYLEDSIDFSGSPHKNIKNRIQTRNGSLTDYLRNQWRLKKVREEGDLHHAQDAIVIACATQGMVKYLSNVADIFENKETYAKKYGEAWYKALKPNFQEPWFGFKTDVATSLNQIFVSRMVRKSATGEVHQEKIRPVNPNHKNYSAKDLKSGIKIRNGHANNGNMLRVDVFSKPNKKAKDEFYLVPIYISDMIKKEIPNKAIVANKNESEWLEMNETYKFKFSLYMDDLIKVTKGKEKIFGYYGGTHRCTGSVYIDIHDRSIDTFSAGAKTQDKFQKYQVNALGCYVEVKSESRLPLAPKSNKQKIIDRKNRKKER